MTARPESLETPILAGNWKMNLVRAEVRAYTQALRAGLDRLDDQGHRRGSVLLFPSAPFLVPVADTLRGTGVLVGGQDLHQADSGAHTGDVSAAQLRSAGATWVLCGHSERRRDHGENDALVAAKTAAALAGGLYPMVCVGETLEQRRAGDTEAVLGAQLDAVLERSEDLGSETWALAYEPVWAIGTGETATPQIAQEAHRFLRGRLVDRLGEAAAKVPILYGGSAKPANCASLLAEADVDGLLIGGASLDSGSFLDMIRRCGR